MKKAALILLGVFGAWSVAGAADKSPTTAEFVKKAAMSDMFEVQSSQLAMQKGDDKDKAFAQQMITDHQKTTAELQDLLTKPGMHAQPPTTLDSKEQKKLDKLNKESGADFAKTYDKMQVAAHQQAVGLFKRYAQGGDNPTLKDWAARTLPVLQQHLQMAQDLGK
jgi:putative membrane protein